MLHCCAIVVLYVCCHVATVGTQCPEAVVPNAEHTVMIGDGRSHSTILQFMCAEGWSLVGVPAVQCGNDSQWLPQLPTCASKYSVL